jgi:photosystem II stability/assembly factor-like uncharacterized protein
MKYLFFILFILSLSNLQAGEWRNVCRKFKYDSEFSKLYFVNNNFGVAMGNRLYITNNGGDIWNESNLKIWSQLLSIDFKNDKLGLMGGKDGYYYFTSNSGTSWKTGNMNLGMNLLGVKIINDSTFIAVNNYYYFKTTNTGKNWEKFLLHKDKKFSAKEITFVDVQNAWIAADSCVFHTSDGGRNWEVQNLPVITGFVDKIDFMDNNYGIVRGRDILYLTTNGGKDWVANKDFGINSISDLAINSDTVIMVSTITDGAYKSIDFGKNWVKVYETRFSDINSSDKHGFYSVNQKNVYRANKLLNDFEPISHLIIGDFVDIFFIDKMNGWAATTWGNIFASNDGGETWKIITKEPIGHIRAIYFIDKLNGWSCGNSKSINKTTDGGITWTAIEADSIPFTMMSFKFITKELGYAVSLSGNFYKSTNSGLSWTKQVYIAYGIYDMDFIDDKNGWVAGNDESIYFTSNGGENWKIKHFKAGYTNYFGIDAYNENRIFAVGQDPSALLTSSTDGGNNWLSNNKGLEDYLGDVKFIDSNHVLVIGNSGEIFKSDMNLNKVYYNSGTGDPLTSIAVIDSENMWVTGWNSTILKYYSTTEIIESRTEDKVQIFPNPANNLLNIKLDCDYVLCSMRIYDIMGFEVFNTQIVGNYYKIDIENLNSGIYTIRIIIGEDIIIKKFIKI